MYDGVAVWPDQGVDGEAPGGGDEGHGEGDDGAHDKQRVKHSQHYQQLTEGGLGTGEINLIIEATMSVCRQNSNPYVINPPITLANW